MKRPLREWAAAPRFALLTMLLLLYMAQQTSSVFQTSLKCEGGKQGTTPDDPCTIQAYLGSVVTLACTAAGYTKKAPEYLVASTGEVCIKKMKVDPEVCETGDKSTWEQLGLGKILISNESLMVPFYRDMKFKGVTTVYGRCAKDDKEAMFWAIKFIPRPMFPENGLIVSCPSLMKTAGQYCELSANLNDAAVFECPMVEPEFVPPQAKDRPNICPTELKAADSTCPAPSDIGGYGPTLVSLANGATVMSVAFKSPTSDSGAQGKDKLEGYVNCKGRDETTFYKYTMYFKEQKYKMPTKFEVCDPEQGKDQATPCAVELKAGETAVINCASLPKSSPANLMKADTGVYCTRMITAEAADLCADDTAMWKDTGAEVFMNANNLVITHKKTDLAKAMTAYGKCFEGADANYFKITLAAKAAGGDTTNPGDGSSAPARSSQLGVILGVLGSIFLATDAICKV